MAPLLMSSRILIETASIEASVARMASTINIISRKLMMSMIIETRIGLYVKCTCTIKVAINEVL